VCTLNVVIEGVI